MATKTSNEASLKPAKGFAIKSTHEDLGVTQYNSSVVHKFVKLNIAKASNRYDRKALNMFNVFVQSS